MNKTIFITGISTEVGKTLTAAIVTEALSADYWKPVQAGELSYSDTHKVKAMISNTTSVFHSNSYALKTPMSPHAAAQLDGIEIELEAIQPPKTNNKLVIEGAGGLLVPLNDQHTILDLIQPSYKVLVVSRHYLGSINHTLMTLELLRQKGLEVALIFSGEEHPTTESIIKKMTGVEIIGRINEEAHIDKNTILRYANLFRKKLEQFTMDNEQSCPPKRSEGGGQFNI